MLFTLCHKGGVICTKGPFSRLSSPLQPITWVCSPDPATRGSFVSGPSTGVGRYTLAYMCLVVKASGRSRTHCGLGQSSDFALQGAFLRTCDPSSDRLFPFACACLHHALEGREKDWLSTLFLVGCKVLSCSPAFSYLKKCKRHSLRRHSLTLCEPLDCSPPGSSVHGILRAGIPEWVTMASSRGSSRPGDRSQVSRVAGGWKGG